MTGGRGRTPEEREAARLERERRRAERQGYASAPVAEPDQPHVAEPDPPRLAEPDPPPVAEPDPPPVDEPEPDAEAEPEPEPYLDPQPEPEPEYDGYVSDVESPAGTRRVSGLERKPSRGHTLRPHRRQPADRPRRPRTDRRFPHGGRILAVLAIILAAALIWFLVELFQPFHGQGSGEVTVTIPAQSSSSQIGDLLAKRGVIASSFFFELRATLAGERGDLRSGTFHLRRDMSYGDVLKLLTATPPAARVTDLTVIEGRTRHQLSALLRSQGVHGSYLAATRHSPLLSPARYGAPQSTPSLEGFLFPSTYQLREPISINALVADQLHTFKRQFATVGLGYARSKNLTPYDVLIIASIIQGEARTARDRALISSVIYNRLKDHMRLQMDDTVRYATGNYDQPITVSELGSRSPWNTYTHSGLPITPISNPGVASIQAAANPARTPYLYFVVKPCGNGAHVFASSYSQFQTLQARYQNARTQRGGNSPEFCR
jgi:uncharacterized YceG family protein